MDTIGCRFNGKSKARGRNGWFIPFRAVVLDFTFSAVPPEFVVEVWSASMRADHPPIMLRLTETDAELLADLLSKGLATFKAEHNSVSCTGPCVAALMPGEVCQECGKVAPESDDL